jgi:hypothetical protein
MDGIFGEMECQRDTVPQGLKWYRASTTRMLALSLDMWMILQAIRSRFGHLGPASPFEIRYPEFPSRLRAGRTDGALLG